MQLKFTFEDGSEALAHYGVKGMKWGKHLKLGVPDISGGGGGMIQDENGEKSNATQAIEDVTGRVRGKLDEAGSHLPENPLYKLKQRVDKAESSGESDAARKRLKDRYSHETVLGKNGAQKSTEKNSHDGTAHRNAYQKESRLNKMEYHGDRKGYKKAQARTDAFYGKKGANAATAETGRRLVNRFVSRTTLAATQNSKKRA